MPGRSRAGSTAASARRARSPPTASSRSPESSTSSRAGSGRVCASTRARTVRPSDAIVEVPISHPAGPTTAGRSEVTGSRCRRRPGDGVLPGADRADLPRPPDVRAPATDRSLAGAPQPHRSRWRGRWRRARARPRWRATRRDEACPHHAARPLRPIAERPCRHAGDVHTPARVRPCGGPHLGLSTVKVLLLENIHPVAVEILEARGFEVELRDRLAVRGRARRGAAGRARCSASAPTPTSPPARARRRATDLLAIGCFCIGTNQVDLVAAAERGDRGVQRAVLQHPQRRGAGDRRDHRAGPPAHREDRSRMHDGRLGQVGQGQPRDPRPHARHRRLRQHRHPAVEPGRGARPAGDLLRHRRPARARQRPPDADASTSCSPRPTSSSLHVDGRPGNAGLLRRRAVREDEAAHRSSSTPPAAWSSTTRRCASTSCPATSPAPRSTSSRSSRRRRATTFESVLRGLDNVILTPHVGGSTQEAQEEIGWFVAGKLAGFVARGPHRAVGQPARRPAAAADRPATGIGFLHVNVPGVLAERQRRTSPSRAPTSPASTSPPAASRGTSSPTPLDPPAGRRARQADATSAAHDLAARPGAPDASTTLGVTSGCDRARNDSARRCSCASPDPTAPGTRPDPRPARAALVRGRQPDHPRPRRRVDVRRRAAGAAAADPAPGRDARRSPSTRASAATCGAGCTAPAASSRSPPSAPPTTPQQSVDVVRAHPRARHRHHARRDAVRRLRPAPARLGARRRGRQLPAGAHRLRPRAARPAPAATPTSRRPPRSPAGSASSTRPPPRPSWPRRSRRTGPSCAAPPRPARRVALPPAAARRCPLARAAAVRRARGGRRRPDAALDPAAAAAAVAAGLRAHRRARAGRRRDRHDPVGDDTP